MGVKKQKYGQIGRNINVWKIIAIVSITLFSLSLVFGMIKAYSFRQVIYSATAEQIDSAKNIVASDLKNSGDSVANYDAHINDKVRILQSKGLSSRVIQVSLKSRTLPESHTYVVELDGRQILLHSRTEFFGDFNNSRADFKRADARHRRGFFGVFKWWPE